MIPKVLMDEGQILGEQDSLDKNAMCQPLNLLPAYYRLTFFTFDRLSLMFAHGSIKCTSWIQ